MVFIELKGGMASSFLNNLVITGIPTFETMFNGLERNFSALESKIQEPRREFQEENAKLNNINQLRRN